METQSNDIRFPKKMRKKIVVLLLLFQLGIAAAQTNGRITYKAFFAKSEATEELKSQNRMRYQERLDEEMMAKLLTYNLDFNQNESLFYLSKSLISEHENQETKKYVTGLFYGYDKIYTNRKKDELIEQLYYGSGTILKLRKASMIQWTLTNETKVISGYKCFKATYTYLQKWRGKEFPWEVVAWYTPDISLPYGPIRYSGLPGLILELSEDNRGFVVDKIEFSKEQVTVEKPSQGEVVTE